jgi:hypothetical protein
MRHLVELALCRSPCAASPVPGCPAARKTSTPYPETRSLNSASHSRSSRARLISKERGGKEQPAVEGKWKMLSSNSR